MALRNQSLYEVLEVADGVTNREIRASYRRLAKKYHPDTNKGNPRSAERFKQINSAYRILGDPASRRAYDRALTARKNTQNHRTSQPNNVTSTGKNVRIRLYLTLDEACKGGTRKLRYPRYSACLVCGGTGILVKGEQDCKACEGLGVVQIDHQVTIKYEAGTLQGDKVIVANAGHADKSGSAPGDLLISILFKKHPYFQFKGADLQYEGLITLEQYIEGGRIKVPTLTRSTTVNVPPRFPDGGTIELSGRGLVSKSRARKGDIIVTIRHCLPRKLSSKEKTKLRELQSLSGFKPGRDSKGFVPRDTSRK